MVAYVSHTEVEDAELKSKINAAGLINSKLEQLWGEAYVAMVEGKYLRWNLKLDAIWLILAGDEEDNSPADKKMFELDNKIYKCGSLSDKQRSGFEHESNPFRSLQFLYLKQKSIFLRRLQNKQGKGTAYINSDEDDFN